MIEVAIITTPRPTPTINMSLQSLRAAGFNDHIHVFAEPGQYEIKGNRHLHISSEKLGCFKNYHRALTHLVNSSIYPFIAVLSDDFVYHSRMYEKITRRLERFPNAGYHALFTPRGMKLDPCNIRKIGWTPINMGWKTSWGGLYVFKKEIAKQIIAHPFYVDHLENYKANQQIDHCIPEVCHQLGYDQFYHNPSFADHIGNASTIGHEHNRLSRGLNFK